MSIRKSLLKSGLAAACTLALASVMAPAASASTLAPDERAELTSFLTEYSVPADTQATLLSELEAGELWDSMRPDASAVTTSQEIVGDAVQVVARFADGSVGVSSVEQGVERPAGTISPRAINGCTATSSGTTRIRTNCDVTYTTGVITMHFTANYRWSYRSASSTYVGSAQIEAANSPRITAIGMSASDPKVEIVRRIAATGAPAVARAYSQVTIAGVLSSTAEMKLIVPIGSTTLAYIEAHF